MDNVFAKKIRNQLTGLTKQFVEGNNSLAVGINKYLKDLRE